MSFDSAAGSLLPGEMLIRETRLGILGVAGPSSSAG